MERCFRCGSEVMTGGCSSPTCQTRYYATNHVDGRLYEVDAPPDPRDAEIARLKAEVTEQTARANAEMRAALAALLPLAFPLDGGSDGCGTVGGWKADLLNDTRALLSRTDLGAGKVLVEREVLERIGKYAREDRMVTPGSTRLARLLADLDALLKRGGG